jgi:RecA/RadA recombinase
MQSNLQRAVDTVRVRFGDQALVRGTVLPAARAWSTGQEAIDRLSGIDGLPRGLVSVLQGEPTSGRLSLALIVLTRATREFARVAVLDPEGIFDPGELLPLQPLVEGLTVLRPPQPAATGEAAVMLARAGAGLLLAIGELPEPALAPLEAAAARSGCAVVALDRGEAGARHRALAHASSLTLSFSRERWIEERGLVVGLEARVRCVKNKLGAPGGEAGMEVRWLGAAA